MRRPIYNVQGLYDGDTALKPRGANSSDGWNNYSSLFLYPDQCKGYAEIDLLG